MDKLPIEIVETILQHVLFEAQTTTDLLCSPLEHLDVFHVNQRLRYACIDYVASRSLFIQLYLDLSGHIAEEKNLSIQYHKHLYSKPLNQPLFDLLAARGTTASIQLDCEYKLDDNPRRYNILVCDSLSALTTIGIVQICICSAPQGCRNLRLRLKSFHPATENRIETFLEDLSALIVNVHSYEFVDEINEQTVALCEYRISSMTRKDVQISRYMDMVQHHIDRIGRASEHFDAVQLLMPVATLLEVLDELSKSLRFAEEPDKVDAQHYWYLYTSYSVLLFQGLSEYLLRNKRTANKQCHWLIESNKSHIFENSLMAWEMNLFGRGSEFDKILGWIQDGMACDFLTTVLMSLIQLRTAMTRAATLGGRTDKMGMWHKDSIIRTLDEFEKMQTLPVVTAHVRVRTWISRLTPFMNDLRDVLEGTADDSILDEAILKEPIELLAIGPRLEGLGKYELRFGDTVLDRQLAAISMTLS